MSGGMKKKGAADSKKMPLNRGVCGGIKMTEADTAIQNAFMTCLDSRLEGVIVVDDSRGSQVYKQQEVYKKMLDRGMKVKFVTSEEKLRIELQDYDIMLTIAPDEFSIKEQVDVLIDKARNSSETYKIFAVAPTYAFNKTELTSVFILMLHNFYSFMSLLYLGRLYQANFMTATVITREVGRVTFPSEKSRAPFIYGGKGVMVIPPNNRSAMDQFLYMASKSPFGLGTLFLLAMYCLTTSVPFWMFNYLGFYQFLAMMSRHTLFIAIFCINFVCGFINSQKYYASMSKPVLLLFLTPIVAIPFGIGVVYAKTFWRGYAGAMPVLAVPPLPDLTFSGIRRGEQDEDDDDEEDYDNPPSPDQDQPRASAPPPSPSPSPSPSKKKQQSKSAPGEKSTSPMSVRREAAMLRRLAGFGGGGRFVSDLVNVDEADDDGGEEQNVKE